MSQLTVSMELQVSGTVKAPPPQLAKMYQLHLRTAPLEEIVWELVQIAGELEKRQPQLKEGSTVAVLAACLHKAEWICRTCAKCAGCCNCPADPIDVVHINSKEAAHALARWARERRQDSKST